MMNKLVKIRPYINLHSPGKETKGRTKSLNDMIGDCFEIIVSSGSYLFILSINTSELSLSPIPLEYCNQLPKQENFKGK